MNRLVIGLDIDGVIIDYLRQILPLLCDIYGRTIRYEDITHPTLSKFLNIDEETSADIWEQILNTDLMQNAPPIEGAIEGLAALSRHEIWLITGREASMEDLTVSWLKNHEIKYDRIMFESEKVEGNLLLEKQCGIFVEDQLEAAYSLAEAGVFTLLFNQPWNQAESLPENCRRVYDWDNIVKIISELAN